MHSRFFAVSLTVAAVVAGCSQTPAPALPPSASAAPAASSAPAPAPAPTTSAPAPATSAAPEKVVTPTAWAKGLSKPQQVAFMKEVVMPRMSKVFQGADAKKYAEFGCKTCHGPDFKEPDDFLPHLTMKNGKITAFAEKPAVSKFMAEKVVPEMAAAMGMKPYDPKTHEGFGCAGCHKIDQK